MIVFLFYCLLSFVFSNDIDVSLNFEQSISNGPWVSRGNLKFVVNKAEKKLSLKFENPTYKISSPEVIDSLYKGWLSVRLPVVDETGQISPNKFLITSIRGCLILKDPKEVLTIFTDKSGTLLGLQYDRPLGSTCEEMKTLPNEIEIISKVIASLPKESSSLPGQVLESVENLKQIDEKEKNEKKEGPQSFLQQYWYIILPSMLLYTFLTAPQEDPNAAASGAAAASGVAGAATTATGGARKRKT